MSFITYFLDNNIISFVSAAIGTAILHRYVWQIFIWTHDSNAQSLVNIDPSL